MTWPENTDYSEAIQNPRLNLADPELKQGQAAANAMGMPIVRSGNFADVYEVRCPSGNSYAVKCFTRQVQDLQQRYQAISEHLGQARLPFAVEFQYQEKGILIKGGWFPILKMRWVEGLTLNRFVDEHADKPRILEQLAHMWIKLAQKLRKANMAHADLQHGNVILVTGKTASSLALKLIDYDGMFVPALAHTGSGEVGHPNFQHPERIAQGFYNAEVDRFSHLVIYTALRGLVVGGRKLWQKYDNGETLLFRETDLKTPATSAVFQELWQTGDPALRALVGRLTLACRGSFDNVPLLDEVVIKGRVVELPPQQEDAVTGLLCAKTGGAAQAPPLDSYAVRPPEITPTTVQMDAYAVEPPVTTAGAAMPEWLEPLQATRESASGAASRRASRSSSSDDKDEEPARASLAGAISVSLIGLLLVTAAWWFNAPFAQATMVLAGLFVAFLGIGIGVDVLTGQRELGANIVIGATGLAWWMAGWWWLDHTIARIGVCIVGGFLFLCHLGFCFQSKLARSAGTRSPERALALRISGFTGLGLFLLAAVIGLAVRQDGSPQDSNIAQDSRTLPSKGGPKPPEVPPVDLPGGHRGLTAIAFSPDGTTAVTGGGGLITTWNVHKRRKLRQLRLAKDGTPVAGRDSPSPTRGVSFLVFSPDGREVLAGAGMALLLFSPDSTYLHHHLLPGDGELVGGSYFSDPDAAKDRPTPFVYAHSSGSIIRWNWQDTAESKGQVPSVLAKAAFTTDGHKALCVSGVATSPAIYLWDVKNGLEIGKPNLSGTHAALARDGKLAISSALSLMSLDDTLPTGSLPIQRLPAPTADITDVALSADGTRAIATTVDGTLHLWHVPFRQELMRLSIDRPKTAGSNWHTVAFAPDGRHALWGSVDGALQWLTLPKAPQN